MIISCSRRTDIPAFYSDWFFNRLREGYVLARNPMNANQIRRVSLLPPDVACIVFWTKDPAPMLDRLHLLKEYHYYFQFTLTPYGRDIEPHLPPKAALADTFIRLSGKIGKKQMVWRYDPVLLSADINIDYHIDRFHDLAKQLSGHTEKCVISFIDMYRHIRGRMADQSVRTPEESKMRTLAEQFARIAASFGMKAETCAEQIDLADLGIKHGSCIDARLISELTGRKLTTAKDKYQRELCGCVASVDIGAYNTCGRFCTYCYANVSRKKVEKNRMLHRAQSPLLIGETGDGRNIT
jgi:hypothetical protein